MEITGKIIQVLPLQSGTSARGEWKKQEFILETEEQYPRKVCISCWGDKVDVSNLKEGENIQLLLILKAVSIITVGIPMYVPGKLIKKRTAARNQQQMIFPYPKNRTFPKQKKMMNCLFKHRRLR
jgi:hypothetical protein